MHHRSAPEESFTVDNDKWRAKNTSVDGLRDPISQVCFCLGALSVVTDTIGLDADARGHVRYRAPGGDDARAEDDE
jgi:hypothetical protein